ncbi:MAG: hypothetical protein N2Z79_03295 [Candidatus Omnitrophica bacterium]|nr:hypothetical protein [Candidatus Omnitrophota bacterium]
MQINKKKRRYEKPQIIYAKKIEIISVVCNSIRAGGGSGVCMKSRPSCTKLSQ